MPTFLAEMNRGRYDPEKGLEGSSYCIFFEPVREPVLQDRISGNEDSIVLELRYGSDDFPGALRIRQEGNNVVLEETADGKFRSWLADKSVKYAGHIVMYALQYKIQDLSDRVARCEEELKNLEDALDNSVDNRGTYNLLDFRRRYAETGAMIIAVKEILERLKKGYYPAILQNSYVLQGRVETDFKFFEERYNLISKTVLKDFDTYTSIVNNNINRNARLLSIISLTGVVLNFMFGSLIVAHPFLGVLGGLSVAGLSLCSIAVYHINRRRPMLSASAELSHPTISEGAKDRRLIEAKETETPDKGIEA